MNTTGDVKKTLLDIMNGHKSVHPSVAMKLRQVLDQILADNGFEIRDGSTNIANLNTISDDQPLSSASQTIYNDIVVGKDELKLVAAWSGSVRDRSHKK